MRGITRILVAGGLLLMLANAGADEGARVETLAQSTSSWDGAELPAYPEGQPEITLLRITVPPGTRLPLHHHPVINAGVLLSGELTVVSETGETLHLRAGDPIIELVDTPHYGRNDGPEPAEIMVFYAGVADHPVTVSEGH
ncbi:MAG: cupin domain-containing protein [Pseudomonadota bacterium]